MKKSKILLISAVILFCSFVGKVRYQKVVINTATENTIYIDNMEPTKEVGKYLIEKNQQPHTITAKREGYKDAITCALPFMSNGYLYPSTYTIGMDMVKLPVKPEMAKNLRINNIALNVKNEDYKYRYFSDYKTYIRKAEKLEATSREGEDDVEVEYTKYSYNLNNFLKEIGFIDTSDKVFKNGYLNNLITNVTITEYIYNAVPTTAYYSSSGMIFIKLKAKWELMDVYEKVLFTYENEMESGKFAYNSTNKIKETVEKTITDALTFGLLDFMASDSVKIALEDKSVETKEANFPTINLPPTSNHVSTLSQAIKSSVTVKSKDSHGSGFVISKDGHIITNYHVVSDVEELKIVMNDKSEHEVEIVRVSKVHDLALLKIDTSNLTPFKISADHEIEIATDIYAVGTPKAEDLSQTVSKGIISGVRKTDQNFSLLQTDASINSGNSGGAIVNDDGVVVGVVSGKLFGFGVEGVGFGIPAYEIYEGLRIK